MFNKIKIFSKVQKFLSDIPQINQGGCGISALSMYRWIKKNSVIGNTKFVFLYPSDEEDRYLNNKRVLLEGEGETNAPSHCVLLYDGDFIDCDGKLNISNYVWIQIIDEEEFIKRALDNVNDWNVMFDRKYIKKIEQKLNISLEDIKGLNEV